MCTLSDIGLTEGHISEQVLQFGPHHSLSHSNCSLALFISPKVWTVSSDSKVSREASWASEVTLQTLRPTGARLVSLRENHGTVAVWAQVWPQPLQARQVNISPKTCGDTDSPVESLHC